MSIYFIKKFKKRILKVPLQKEGKGRKQGEKGEDG